MFSFYVIDSFIRILEKYVHLNVGATFFYYYYMHIYILDITHALLIILAVFIILAYNSKIAFLFNLIHVLITYKNYV